MRCYCRGFLLFEFNIYSPRYFCRFLIKTSKKRFSFTCTRVKYTFANMTRRSCEVLRKDLPVVDFRPKSQYRVWKLGKVFPTFLTFNLYPSLQSVTTGDGKQSKARFKRHISAEWNYECVTSTIQEQMRYFDFAFHSTFLFLHSTARIFRTQHLLRLSGI